MNKYLLLSGIIFLLGFLFFMVGIVMRKKIQFALRNGLLVLSGLVMAGSVVFGFFVGDLGRRDKPKEQKVSVAKDEKKKKDSDVVSKMEKTYEYINATGKTLEKRINVPEGYERTEVSENGLGNFLRSYKMKKDKSPVLLYDGSKKGNQNAHVAVFKLPIENEDLQQCADSIMRVYGEYYFAKGKYNKIKYNLGSGFVADFSKWSQGYGISINGGKLVWSRSASNDTSYRSFQKFMRIVFAYSGTLNLEEASKKIKLRDIRIGDMFIKGGSPGHVVMVVDVCKNVDGKKAFLLAQGYMPAQEFHVIKNPMHEENPWYYQDEISYPLSTAQYTFEQGSLRRPEL